MDSWIECWKATIRRLRLKTTHSVIFNITLFCCVVMLIDIEDRKLREDVEGNAGLYAKRLRQFNEWWYRTDTPGSIRHVARVPDDRIHHTEVMWSHAGRRTSRLEGIRHRYPTRSVERCPEVWKALLVITSCPRRTGPRCGVGWPNKYLPPRRGVTKLHRYVMMVTEP